MVFQSYAVWPHMTVFENVAFPLIHGRKKVAKDSVEDKVRSVLRLVQIGELSDRPSTDLSGGQQQRIALARAWLRNRRSCSWTNRSATWMHA